MAFDSFTDFLAMGGHGFYVWLSYGVMAIGVLTLVVSSRRSQQRWIHQQQRQWQRLQAQKKAQQQQQQQAVHQHDAATSAIKRAVAAGPVRPAASPTSPSQE